MYLIVLCDASLKTPNFYKECMSSLGILPPRNFALFVSQFLLEYYTWKSKNFTHYRVSYALYMFVARENEVSWSLVCSQFVSISMPSLQGHPKTQTLQTADRAHSQTVQAVKTEYFFFLLFVEILISRNMNVNKQDRVLFLVLWLPMW